MAKIATHRALKGNQEVGRETWAGARKAKGTLTKSQEVGR